MAFVSDEHEAAFSGSSPAASAVGRFIRRAAVAAGVGALVLVGWSAAASAEATTGPAQASVPTVITTTPPAPAEDAPHAAPRGSGLVPVTGLLAPVTSSLGTTLGTVTAPVTTGLAPTVTSTSAAVEPVVDAAVRSTASLAPVIVPLVETVQPTIEPVLVPIGRDVLAPVVDDVVAPLVVPTVEPMSEAIADGLGALPSTPTTDALADLLAPIAGPALAPLAPLADGIQIIDAIDLDRDPATGILTAEPAPAGEDDGTVLVGSDDPDDVQIIDAIDLDRTPATSADAAAVPTSDERPATPATDRPDNSPCSPRTCAVGGLLVFTTLAAIGGLTATSRRNSARSTSVDMPSGRPLAQPGFAPD